jgi:hypothetical protein
VILGAWFWGHVRGNVATAGNAKFVKQPAVWKTTARPRSERGGKCLVEVVDQLDDMFAVVPRFLATARSA